MKIALAALIAAVLAMPAGAQEKPKSSWGDFFKNLKSSLAQSAVGGERKKARGGAAVAAVRGKKQKDMADPNEPTLKGDAKTQRAQKEMALDADFEKAVDLVRAGKLDDASRDLRDFKAKHPKHRSEDVDKAIEGVSAMIAEKAGEKPAATAAAAATPE